MKLFKKRFPSLASCFGREHWRAGNLSFCQGFTLIELLVVIIILGIIAAAVLVAINPGQTISSARNARVKSDIAEIGKAAGIFNANTGNAGTGSYPRDFDVTLSGVTFMAALNDPSGTVYDFEAAPASCDMTTVPCDKVSIMGPAYADGVETAGQWCWRSVRGVVFKTVTGDINCNP